VVYRLSWLAGAAGIGLALLRIERLLRPSTEGLPWEFVLVAAALLGSAITWAALSYRLGTRSVVAVNLVAATLTAFRIAVPGTTWFIFPTLDSLDAMRAELSWAGDTIRSAVPPVLPLAGIVAIAAVLFWALGALLSWGVLRGRPYAAVLPPLVVYLQFATMDRIPSGYWSWAFLTLLGFTLLAVAVDRRRAGSGVLTTGSRRKALSRAVPTFGVVVLAATLAAAVLSTNAVAGLVPSSGLLEWRVNSGLSGQYHGSLSYNPFVGIRQDLVSSTDNPVLVATVAGSSDPSSLYWRLLTLDSYSGGQWFLPEGTRLRSRSDVDTFEAPDTAFKGPTRTVTQTVTILDLQQEWLPAVYAVRDLSADSSTVEQGVRVRLDDGSVRFDASSYYGMRYDVVSAVPEPDLEVLSRTASGELSPVFSAAAEDGDFPDVPADEPIPTFDLPNEERFLELPEDEGLDRIADLTREQTRGLATDYERALALEAFFRRGGSEFRYSTDIDPGHGATDLAAWLLDPDSTNYRTGYCEQFATSMGVMARQIGIPSRVALGFTPGPMEDDGRVLIRDRNAHAWVELWMPSQGWVRFDPTPRGDGVNPASSAELGFDVSRYLDTELASPPTGPRPTPSVPSPFDMIPDDLPTAPPVGLAPGDGPVPWLGVPPWAAAAVLAVVLGAAAVPSVKWIRRRRRLRRLAAGDITAAWVEIVDRLSDLGAGPAAADTPVEFAGATHPAMVPLAEVYGSSLYGPDSDSGDPQWITDSERVAVATRSLAATERHLVGRSSLRRRVAAAYGLASLEPAWWRRIRRRPNSGRNGR
jgi:transglutaminase-like putative cysteine protease